MCVHFLIFVAAIDYKNIFTMKVSRFTVLHYHTCHHVIVQIVDGLAIVIPIIPLIA